MRHRVKTKTLHRNREHRLSLLRNLSDSLVMHENIVTTVAKAKYLRPYVEKLVTKAKVGNTFNNVKYLKNKLTTDDAVRKMLTDLGPRFSTRKGGYTRIVKLGNRAGDNAQMARIEFVEKAKEEKAKKKVEKKPTKAAAKKDAKAKTEETPKAKKKGRPKKEDK